MNKRRTSIILGGICVIIGLVFIKLIPQKCSNIEEKVNPLSLNKIITNEASDTIPELKGLDNKIARYMSQWQLQGASLAIMRNDSLLYAKGYGWADKEKDVEMDVSKIMRVASVSKLITAVGIMKLKEEGKLKLSDHVFGNKGILNDTTFTSSIKNNKYYDITVEHLLRHQGGFGGWDPMFNTRTIMTQNKLDKAPNSEELARIVLKRRLRFTPGKGRSYSNFGYLLLSMIIEKVSGMPYDKYIQEHVLEPAGCLDMHLATNYYKHKRKNEVRYYVPDNEELVPEYNNSDKEVIRCYGGNDIEALKGAGAWVTSTLELAKLVASIDGNPIIPDILSPESVKEMTQYYDKNTFSLGWNDTNPKKGWSRTGTFSGTTALIKYFPDGECWIFVSNTSTWKGPRFNNYTSGLFNNLRKSYSDKLPKRNLFTTK